MKTTVAQSGGRGQGRSKRPPHCMYRLTSRSRGSEGRGQRAKDRNGPGRPPIVRVRAEPASTILESALCPLPKTPRSTIPAVQGSLDITTARAGTDRPGPAAQSGRLSLISRPLLVDGIEVRRISLASTPLPRPKPGLEPGYRARRLVGVGCQLTSASTGCRRLACSAWSRRHAASRMARVTRWRTSAPSFRDGCAAASTCCARVA